MEIHVHSHTCNLQWYYDQVHIKYRRISRKCSHIVGLVKYIQQFKQLGLKEVPADQACTSLPQQWHIPIGNKINPDPNDITVVKSKETHKKCP